MNWINLSATEWPIMISSSIILALAIIMLRAFLRWFIHPLLRPKMVATEIHHIEIHREIINPLNTPTDESNELFK